MQEITALMDTHVLRTRLVWVCLFFIFPLTAQAELQNRTIGLRMGLIAADLNYEERPAGAASHNEEGTVPGIYVSFKEQSRRVYGEMVIHYYNGTTDYVGQAQDTPGNFLGLISAETDTELVDVNYRIGGLLNQSVEMYAGIGYHYHRRDINAAQLTGGAPVEGQLQRLTWFYGLLGMKYHFIRQGDSDLAINVQARRMINPRVNAKTSTVSTTIDLDETWGYQLSLPYTFKMSSRYFMTVEPFAKQWRMDRATDGLGNSLSDSDLDVYGVNFILGW